MVNEGLGRRDFLTLAALAGAALALPRAAWAGGNTPALPNFILCMADDLGWQSLSCCGQTKIKTANLDAMAAGGIRFNRFYSAAPVCSPTRLSVITGRHPYRYGCGGAGSGVKGGIEKIVSVAQALQSAGYTTAHFGKWHIGAGNKGGKEVVMPAEHKQSPTKFGFDEWLSAPHSFDLDATLSRRGSPEKLSGDGSDAIMAQALKFMERCTAQKKPFMALVWFGSPHLPCEPLPEDLKAAGGNAWAGELLGIDRAMGTLRAGLRRLKIQDQTLIWFNGDNGGVNGNEIGPLKGAKHSIWEGGIRVPGLVEWPSVITRPLVTEVPAVTSDIYPTLLDLAGVKQPEAMQPLDGISLAPLIKGQDMKERGAPIGFWHDKGKGEGLEVSDGHAALIDNQYKLHRLNGKFELYDVAADAPEKSDLAGSKPEILARMKPVLEKWQESVAQSYPRKG